MTAAAATIGPRIIAEHMPDPEPLRSAHEGTNGILRTPHGSWSAVVNGRIVGVWSGTGSKLRAIRHAGTNTVLT